MSRLFSQTLREAPAEAETPGYQLLLRAGYIRQLAAGIFSYLPLARRTLDKIEAIVRAEMDAIGGQEVSMPVVHPADLWRETGRWFTIDAEMSRFNDRAGRDMVLAMTHEEVVADLVRREIRSYRQLPQLIYQIQTKWRDDPRPRAGLIRVREFTMKDSYSLDTDLAGLDKQYRAHYQAYFNIYHRCGLTVHAVGADVGMMGGSLAHEYMYLTPAGEDTVLFCDQCGYAANRQIARFIKPAATPEAPLPVEEVATPDTKTIEALAALLGAPKAKTAKAVFLVATLQDAEDSAKTTERLVFAVVRGDMDVNETKLANVLKARALRPATDEEIQAVGATPGYASPLGLGHERAMIVADDAIPASPNLVAGANRAGYHLLNTNYGRDYTAHIVADIAAAGDGDACPRCQHPLRTSRAVEVGNIFKLGTRYSDALGCLFNDADGQLKPVIMGSYGIGIGRLLACIAEAHHDADGLIWPVSVAPFAVHLVGLDQGGEAGALAEQVYRDLWAAGLETLFDDRDERPGVKFKDADLIGIPLRLTVSSRALQNGGVEFKPRRENERRIVPVEALIGVVKAALAAHQAEIDQRVVNVPFPEE
ncbi:MAG: proline--tRNA ligase [Anaerolineae bacterium]|nr:proline--tRNA ligase [Anaerolineae bacterium]